MKAGCGLGMGRLSAGLGRHFSAGGLIGEPEPYSLKA